MTRTYMNGDDITLAIEHLANCKTLDDLLRAAGPIDYGHHPMEFNFHAHVLMMVDAALATGTTIDLLAVRRQAECGMLQVALLNIGEQPPSPFIMAMHKAGWRVVQGVLTPKPMPQALELTPQ